MSPLEIWLFGGCFAAIAGAFGFAWSNKLSGDRAAAEIEREVQVCTEGYQREIQRVEQNLHEYKRHVAENFSSAKHLEASEQRTQADLAEIKTQLRDISLKLDRQIERSIVP